MQFQLPTAAPVQLPSKEVATPTIGFGSACLICVAHLYGITIDTGTAAAIVAFLMTTAIHVFPSQDRKVRALASAQLEAAGVQSQLTIPGTATQAVPR